MYIIVVLLLALACRLLFDGLKSKQRQVRNRSYVCFGCGRPYRYVEVNQCPWCGRKPYRTW